MEPTDLSRRVTAPEDLSKFAPVKSRRVLPVAFAFLSNGPLGIHGIGDPLSFVLDRDRHAQHSSISRGASLHAEQAVEKVSSPQTPARISNSVRARHPPKSASCGRSRPRPATRSAPKNLPKRLAARRTSRRKGFVPASPGAYFQQRSRSTSTKSASHCRWVLDRDLRRVQHPRISRSASPHPEQTVGKVSSAPTPGAYFQQRSHFSPSARSTSTEIGGPLPFSTATCETINNAGSSVSYSRNSG